MVEVDWNTTACYGRTYPEPAERTPEEQAEIEKLEARQGVLAELDDDDWTEELVREAETIEDAPRRDRGRRSRPGPLYRNARISGSPAASPPSDSDGTLQVIHGLVTARGHAEGDRKPPRNNGARN